MIPFRRILFPVDLSEKSLSAVPYVKAMAERFQAEIIVQHVLEIPIAALGPPEAVWASASGIEALREQRQKLLDKFIHDHFCPPPVRKEFTEGVPAFEIISLAQRENVDLIMMLTHGHGTFRRLLLGSVADKVLHDCDCAIWTGVHAADLVTHDPTRLRSILCLVDEPEKDRNAVEWAGALANATAAELHVVQGEEQPKRAVHDLAQKLNADLVVIGRTNRKIGRLRDEAYETIRQSPCPVISV